MVDPIKETREVAQQQLQSNIIKVVVVIVNISEECNQDNLVTAISGNKREK